MDNAPSNAGTKHLGQVLSLYPAIAVVMLTDATKIVTSLWPILLAPGLFVSGLLIIYFRGKTEDMIFQLHPLGAGFGLLVLLFLSIQGGPVSETFAPGQPVQDALVQLNHARNELSSIVIYVFPWLFLVSDFLSAGHGISIYRRHAGAVKN